MRILNTRIGDKVKTPLERRKCYYQPTESRAVSPGLTFAQNQAASKFQRPYIFLPASYYLERNVILSNGAGLHIGQEIASRAAVQV